MDLTDSSFFTLLSIHHSFISQNFRLYFAFYIISLIPSTYVYMTVYICITINENWSVWDDVSLPPFLFSLDSEICELNCIYEILLVLWSVVRDFIPNIVVGETSKTKHEKAIYTRKKALTMTAILVTYICIIKAHNITMGISQIYLSLHIQKRHIFFFISGCC